MKIIGAIVLTLLGVVLLYYAFIAFTFAADAGEYETASRVKAVMVGIAGLGAIGAALYVVFRDPYA